MQYLSSNTKECLELQVASCIKFNYQINQKWLNKMMKYDWLKTGWVEFREKRGWVEESPSIILGKFLSLILIRSIRIITLRRISTWVRLLPQAVYFWWAYRSKLILFVYRGSVLRNIHYKRAIQCSVFKSEIWMREQKSISVDEFNKVLK